MDPNAQVPQVENPLPQTSAAPPVVESPVPAPVTPPAPPAEVSEPTTPQPLTEKKNSPILLVAVILAVIAVLAVVVYAIAGKLMNQEPTATVAPVVSTPTPTPDPTANWKTYTNSTYSFKYPSNWLLNDLTNGQQVETYYQPDKTKPVGSLLVEKLSKAPGNLSSYIDTKQIGTASAKCLTDASNLKTWCYLSESKISILITKDQDLDYNQNLDQILSTFKFITATPSATPTIIPTSSPTSSPSATYQPY